MSAGKIVKVSGPLVVAEGLPNAKMYDVVKVSNQELVGEIVEIKGNYVSIQVYEETGGLGPGDPVISTNAPLSVELGPGILESIYDGIQRPLDGICRAVGDLITRGVSVPSLKRDRKWAFTPTVKKGMEVAGGDILGTVPETVAILHKVMVPPEISGKVIEIKKGEFTVEDTVAVLEDASGKKTELSLMQKWPVRKARPFKNKLAPTIPLSSGQRIIDMLFPLAKGGTACVPGPFGSGKTVVQHQLAKWADAEIIVYVGCGERGNEMTDVLIEMPELTDPTTGHSLMTRTVLIANTSNMPVAAREASIYTGITIAEYYRDMGYDVALMADSTSRWAEALREMSGRLEEMPGEEGYPAYLATKLADFYERAGFVETCSSDNRTGSITAIGAVSPPGGDMSDPVVQATLKVVKVFWGLDYNLAYRRHFPAINWLLSYSLYGDNLNEYYDREISTDWNNNKQKVMSMLQKEAELEEIVRLVGKDSLSQDDQLTMEITKIIREDFLHQNAFHKLDSYTSLKKQFRMLNLMLALHAELKRAMESGIKLDELIALPIVEKVSKCREILENEFDKFDKLQKELHKEISKKIEK
ncbi:MAG: V-type ATP synthase subunit A [bacterium]